MTNTTTTKRPTKRTMYNALLAIPEVKGNTELVDFINREIALLDKKNATNSAKQTPTQKANEGIKTEILAYLVEHKPTGYTVSELIKNVEVCNGMSTSKVSALVRQLIDESKVERYEEKRKAYFRAVEVAE